ncbi:MAG: monooxygenase, partial [Acidimicrobiia bacterium]|nr:monooxygenase [Acidimicrobiia bacterium]
LGLAGALDRVAVRPRTGDLRRWQDWSLITSQPLGDRAMQDCGYPYYHLHRADLHRVLVDPVAEECPIRLGHRVAGVDADGGGGDGGGARLRFEGGGEARADVVVGPDGIRSTVRAALFGPEAPRFSGMSVWRGLVPAEDVADLGLPLVSTAVLGPGQHFVYYYVSAGRFVNWVGVAPSDTWALESWTTPGELADALADFAGWAPIVLRLISAAAGPDRASTLYRWALYDRDPMAVWGAGPVTLLGDAAHPMLPFMAQGAAQAIEDAAVLAACLQLVPGPVRALRRYEDLRRERTAQVQLAARFNEVTFHLPDGPEQQERDRRLAAASGEKASHRNAWVFEYDTDLATAHL